MHALEYLAAGLIMIIFISFSSAVIMPNVYIPVTHIKEQQLDILAERITDKILLTPGAPYNWHEVEVIEPPAPEEKTCTLRPKSAISPTSWTVDPPSINATKALSDSNNNTYISTSTKGSSIKFNLTTPDPECEYGTITSLTVYVCGKGKGNINIKITVGVYEESESKFFDQNNWTTRSFTPREQSWTWSEIKGLHITISSTQNQPVSCSELWVIVKYKIEVSRLRSKTLNGFGLALYGENAPPYTLDRDKVLRLTDNSSKLPPLNVSRCLGLMEDGHLKYGFEIVIKQAIYISRKFDTLPIDKNHNAYKSIKVKAINYEGIPLANAKVYGILVVFYVDQTSVGYKMLIFKSTTNVLGEAAIDFTYEPGFLDMLSKYQDYTFLCITCVDFYGLRSYTVDSPSNVKTPAFIIPTEGGILCLHNASGIAQGTIHMRGVFAVSLPYVASTVTPKIHNVWIRTKGAESLNLINHGGKNYAYYSLEGVEQEINTIGIYFKYTGEFHFYIVSLPFSTGGEIRYSNTPSMGAKKTIVVAKRLVKIEGMDYVFEFKMWRMAED